MTIKEVENITGLTAKSIRFYEKKNLIEVQRNEGNDYRNYTEENVVQLKWIKLFRYLDFSIEEIKVLLALSSEEVEERLVQKYQMMSEQTEEIEMKQNLLTDLLSNVKKGDLQIDEYLDAVDFLESDEVEEVSKYIRDIRIPTFTSCLWTSMICLGPIGMLFIHIYEQKWAVLPFNAVLALAAMVLLTITWNKYLVVRRYQKEQMRERNREQTMVWPFLILSIVLAGVFIIGGGIVCERMLAPDGWLFYEHNEIAMLIAIWISVIGAVTILYLIRMIILQKSRGKNIVLVVGAFLIMLMIICGCLTNVTFVTDDSIVTYTPFNLSGSKYEYTEIEKVKTGFGKQRFSLLDSNRRGTFTYTILLKDKEIIFSAPSVNESIERYSEDTYLELEEFDAKLMEIGIKKESGIEYAEYCDLDEEYVDRFLRIIEREN